MRTQVAVMVVGIGALVVIAGAPVRAHHAFAAEFDANSPIELTGTVVRMEWVNPHTWIHIDVEQDDGAQQRWMIEGGPPTSLLRRGFTKRSLLAGTEVFVEGFRAKDGSNKANGRGPVRRETGETPQLRRGKYDHCDQETASALLCPMGWRVALRTHFDRARLGRGCRPGAATA